MPSSWPARSATRRSIVYLTKPIAKPDLTGLKIRITPVYRDFFTALGATVVQTAPGEVYTALERGVVDGYGWPTAGIFDLGWHEKTKFRVDPGFYTRRGVLPHQQDDLGQARRRATQGDRRCGGPGSRRNRRHSRRRRTRPTSSARSRPASRRSSSRARTARPTCAKAYEAGWAGIIKQSPEHGPKLREFFAKAK